MKCSFKVLTPNICLRSGSRKRKGMLETCNLLGCCFSEESECWSWSCWEPSICVTSSVCQGETNRKDTSCSLAATVYCTSRSWSTTRGVGVAIGGRRGCRVGQLTYSASAIFQSGEKAKAINSRWLIVSNLRLCITNPLINLLHLALEQQGRLKALTKRRGYRSHGALTCLD